MNEETEKRNNGKANIADIIRQWLVAAATVVGVFGAIIYGQIIQNQTNILTADHVEQIQRDIKEIRSSLDGMPQTVRNLQEQSRDQQIVNGVQNTQINQLGTLAAETKIRVDNLERASNTKLR